MSDVTILVPDDAELFSVAHEALAQGAKIIFNGKRFAIAKTIPPGWTPLSVGFKQPAPTLSRISA